MAAAEVSGDKVVWQVLYQEANKPMQSQIFSTYEAAKKVFDDYVDSTMKVAWGRMGNEGELLCKIATNMVDQQQFFGGISLQGYYLTLLKMTIAD